MKYQNSPENIFEVPPVRNPFLYCWHIFVKILSFAVFGSGSLLITIVSFPVMKLLWRKKEDFQKHGRRMVSRLFAVFIGFMKIIGCVRFSVDDRKKLKNLNGCVVVANHPSLLDVVMLISCIPNADCIVNGSLKKHIVSRIVSNLYITNDVEYEQLLSRCKESINQGYAIVIFPEGTRSRIDGQNQFKKGAARIALAAGCPVVPVFIGGNDKIGLRKKDSMFLYNHTERYDYRLYVKEQIETAEFKELPEPAAAKHIMEKIHQQLCYENNMDNISGKNPEFVVK